MCAYYLNRRTFTGVFCTPIAKLRRMLVGIRLGSSFDGHKELQFVQEGLRETAKHTVFLL